MKKSTTPLVILVVYILGSRWFLHQPITTEYVTLVTVIWFIAYQMYLIAEEIGNQNKDILDLLEEIKRRGGE